MRYNTNDYTLFKKATFKHTSCHKLYLVADEKCSPLVHDNPQSPLIIIFAGRPKKKKEFGEAKPFKRSSSMKCSRYD